MTRDPLLTDAEMAFIDLMGRAWNDLCAIVDDGPTRDADLAEAIGHVHALQHAVMAQAASRAYPDHLRRLGAIVGDDNPDHR